MTLGDWLLVAVVPTLVWGSLLALVFVVPVRLYRRRVHLWWLWFGLVVVSFAVFLLLASA